MNKNELKVIQDTIGYYFKNPVLLEQAFTRKSYSQENGGYDNEVLEYIGDKALDLVVIRWQAEKYGHINDDWNYACDLTEGELTKMKQHLVEKKTLATCIDRLELSSFLAMGKGDKNDKVNLTNAKEDLFEAILGAVALDSLWNVEILQRVFETMVEPQIWLEENNEPEYVTAITEWTEKRYNQKPSYYFYNSSELFTGKENECICVVKLGELGTYFKEVGSSKKEAREKACQKAYKYLDEHNELPTIKDEINNPNLDDAISQLEILSRRGYFEMPVYDFKETYDNDGNPIWTCIGCINNLNESIQSVSSSKKLAKKEVAYKLLLEELNRD